MNTNYTHDLARNVTLKCVILEPGVVAAKYGNIANFIESVVELRSWFGD